MTPPPWEERVIVLSVGDNRAAILIPVEVLIANPEWLM